MSQPVRTTFTAHFAQVPDPRLDRTKEHQLLDILTIAICAESLLGWIPRSLLRLS